MLDIISVDSFAVVSMVLLLVFVTVKVLYYFLEEDDLPSEKRDEMAIKAAKKKINIFRKEVIEKILDEIRNENISLGSSRKEISRLAEEIITRSLANEMELSEAFIDGHLLRKLEKKTLPRLAT